MKASGLREWYGKRVRVTTDEGTFDGELNYSVQEDAQPSLVLDGSGPHSGASYKRLDPEKVSKVEDLFLLEHRPDIDPTEIHRTPDSGSGSHPDFHGNAEAKRALNLAPTTGNPSGNVFEEQSKPAAVKNDALLDDASSKK